LIDAFFIPGSLEEEPRKENVVTDRIIQWCAKEATGRTLRKSKLPRGAVALHHLDEFENLATWVCEAPGATVPATKCDGCKCSAPLLAAQIGLTELYGKDAR